MEPSRGGGGARLRPRDAGVGRHDRGYLAWQYSGPRCVRYHRLCIYCLAHLSSAVACMAKLLQTGEETTVEEQQEVVRQAVATRLDALDEAFLPVTQAYIAAAHQQGQQPTADLLETIHSEVLRQVKLRIPPEMQVLDSLISLEVDARCVIYLRAVTSCDGSDAKLSNQSGACGQPARGGGRHLGGAAGVRAGGAAPGGQPDDR